MNIRTAGLRVAGAVFGLFSVVQLLRLMLRADVRVAGHEVPLWSSALASLLGAGLSASMTLLSCSERK